MYTQINIYTKWPIAFLGSLEAMFADRTVLENKTNSVVKKMLVTVKYVSNKCGFVFFQNETLPLSSLMSPLVGLK